MENIYNTYDRDRLILQLAEILKDMTNWGKFDSPEEWDRKIVAFDRVVKQIPTEQLEPSVMCAVQNHKKHKDFAPFQVVEAWNEIGEVIARDKQGGHLERQENLKCPYCKGVGFIYLQNIDGCSRAVSPCKNKCKAVTDLTRKADPMPASLKELLKTLGKKIPTRPDSMPMNFNFK